VLVAGVALGLAFGLVPISDPTVSVLGKLLYPPIFAASIALLAWCALNVVAFAAFGIAVATEWTRLHVVPVLSFARQVFRLVRPMRRSW
jgi:hypothetical protein